MHPALEEDWSDSDEENFSEVETSVLLGIPDGVIDNVADITDVAVSRIGGHPAFLPSPEPPFPSSQCKLCSNAMELLVQLWCPFEDSPMDRALYVWGCAKASCQGKAGSVRAWRGLRFNAKYAAKLEQKLARKNEEAERKNASKVPKPKPFSMQGTQVTNPFSIGMQVSGDIQRPPASEEQQDDGDDSDRSESSEESILTAMASTTISESPWSTAPSYQPIYLSTVSEHLPPLPKTKLPPGVRVEDMALDELSSKGSKDISWALEPYENSVEVDHVFERFSERVSYEAEQCVRYELSGVPLPYASDKVFETLFPAPPAPLLPVTKPDFKVIHRARRAYSSTNLPPCPICKAQRVFECQLMPNLINVLEGSDSEKIRNMTDEQRRRAVELMLKRDGSDKKLGMGWGTCMIFSCSKDCCLRDDGQEEDVHDLWREEYVLVQWDV